MLARGVTELGAQLGGLVVGPAAALNPLLLPRAAYGLIVRPNDFASYLLAIGICNLLLYFAFYIIMKVPFLWPGVLLSLEGGGPPRGPPMAPLTTPFPAAPERRASAAGLPALHCLHLRGVGLRPLLLLPGPEHLAGELTQLQPLSAPMGGGGLGCLGAAGRPGKAKLGFLLGGLGPNPSPSWLGSRTAVSETSACFSSPAEQPACPVLGPVLRPAAHPEPGWSLLSTENAGRVPRTQPGVCPAGLLR